MVDRNKTDVTIGLLDHARGNAASDIYARLTSLLQAGENADVEDYESVQDWINIVFDELKCFPSEHRTLRLHYLHIACCLLSICIDKAGETRQLASDQITNFKDSGTRVKRAFD